MKKTTFLIISIYSSICNILEISSYTILYYHVWTHDNRMASEILDQRVIRTRNRANAISLIGLFSTWIFEVSYLVVTGFLSFAIKNHDFLRELVWCYKAYEYFFIPLVQIYTSPIMKVFKSSQS